MRRELEVEMRGEFEQRELHLAVQLTRHREKYQAAVQACIGKWGSESRSVMLGSTFHGWIDAFAKAKQLRKHAMRIFMALAVDPPPGMQ